MDGSRAAAGRVHGWDLLRGACALAVASYHLLLWTGTAAPWAWGSYGVYLFFILSGASLAYTYSHAQQAGALSWRAFLWARYVRLAPLYLLAMLLSLPLHLSPHAAGSAPWWRQAALNASLLHGLVDPVANEMVIGGWSLGVEVAFYLAFPWLLGALLRPRLRWLVLGAAGCLQAGWILRTIGSAQGYAGASGLYHQVPAFAAYFLGGCALGAAHARHARRPLAPRAALLALAGAFAALLLQSTGRQGDELLGWRGVLLPLLCFALVALAGRMQVDGRLRRLAESAGDATYGLYLLHPVLYFSAAYFLFPALGVQPQRWGLPARAAFLLALGACAWGLALLLERRFERPLRGRARQWFAAPGATPAAWSRAG